GNVVFAEGEVDPKALNDWIDWVRTAAEGLGQLPLCDSLIGELLAWAPADPGGPWPCEPVRNMIERVSSDKLENGICAGVFNKRGIHWVEPQGKQEMRIAGRFDNYSAMAGTRWPRTGRLLHRIADAFRDQARRQIREERLEEFE